MRIKSGRRAHRFVLAAVLTGAVAAVALAFIPTAMEASPSGSLSARVVSTNLGPIPACSDPSNCTAANIVSNFIYVRNRNPLINAFLPPTRTDVPNAFVVSSVDLTVFVNGVQFGSTFTVTPPPNQSGIGVGHWPATVTCIPSCYTPLHPAVVPGEDTAVLYAAWVHGTSEPTGTYVFTYTVHGTLNNNPINLTASSPPISMT